MFSVMIRPKWLAALGLVLLLATVFVLLSGWQFSRADDNAEIIDPDFDTVKSLVALQEPNRSIQEAVAAHRVEVTGQFSVEQLIVVEGKGFRSIDVELVVSDDEISVIEQESAGLSGSWVVARFEAESASEDTEWVELAVVLGWAESTEQALELLPTLQVPEGEQTIVGRFYPVEPVNTDVRIDHFTDSSGEKTFGTGRVAVASLVNLWEGPLSPARYNGYLVGEFSVDGLTQVHTQAPDEEVHLNILNLFYAAEWIFFAGFAGYIWFRLVKDEYLAEQEAAAEAAAKSGGELGDGETESAADTSADSKTGVN